MTQKTINNFVWYEDVIGSFSSYFSEEKNIRLTKSFINNDKPIFISSDISEEDIYQLVHNTVRVFLYLTYFSNTYNIDISLFLEEDGNSSLFCNIVSVKNDKQDFFIKSSAQEAIDKVESFIISDNDGKLESSDD